MTKLQVHAATDIPPFQHGTSPGRACDFDQNGLRTVLRMSRNQSRTPVQKHRRVAVVLRLDLQHSGRREVFEEDPSFNLRLDDIVIHFVAEIGMRREQ